ncbi:hypothetical protein BDV95DRAFT_601750 [Massariosphaeria phaeospora]|uniref:Protein kinase domain-containing protein n=1 Tax=Massariosphaeria phaeospora TaxID=100035 RepID=A0A7C8MJT9_9PLEO|nr:hypothetical protein BDV95DRAFT_601750 [Massariosphaeria phaeospora]
MPNLLAPEAGESSRSRSRQRARTEVSEHRSMWNRLSLQKIGSWLKREEEEPPPPDRPSKLDEENKENGRPHSSGEHASRPSGLLGRRSSRRVVPGLPRPLTFRRMNSEKRDKLLPVPLDGERRAASADRRESSALKRTLSPPDVSFPSMSAPDVLSPHHSDSQQKPQPTIGGGFDSNIPAGARQVDYGAEESIDYLSAGEPPPLSAAGDSFYERGSHRSDSDIDETQLQEELEAKWILNLSMHFRDMSDREKFFITFAEEPNKWRRVTVSCDYRQLTPDSLEADLKSLHYQRDKSARIYEAIRDSLPDIQFYDTVTNLKLQTADGRLHVHVTEDVNEIIPYPSTSAIEHLECKTFRESALSFDSHISGFVYKVSVNNRTYIKKEIPGPDAVEEFLYEINALCSLQESKSVVRFEGIIVDEKSELIKGLIISYADQGALVDLLYDFKHTDVLPWARCEKWARQIVEGLSEIHEAGFVQGDFTLSNIVIDRADDAKIIDINRRGCPVGWEPPELAKLIESGQRISIYIGVKSDLFQLGMVLWALAQQEDEPERQERPLGKALSRNLPAYFREIVRACLSESPRERLAAKDILARFPDRSVDQLKPVGGSRQSVSTHRSDKEYIDPATAVDLEDISKHRRPSRSLSSFSNVHMPSTEYIGSSSSYVIPNPTDGRGRSPGVIRSTSGNRRSDCSPYAGPRSIMSLDDSELAFELASLPASRDTRWEQVYVDGDTKLVQRGGGELDTHDFANQEPKDVCITTPPGELDTSFMGSKTSDETPLSLSTVAELQPIPPPPISPATDPENLSNHHRGVGTKASFSDRVHQLVDANTPHHHANAHIANPSSLAALEHEIGLDSSVPSSAFPSRVGTGFSVSDVMFHRPTHQDSGFSEPAERENERIRQSLELNLNLADLKVGARGQKYERGDDGVVDERLWEDSGEAMIGQGVRGAELVVRPCADKHVDVDAANTATATAMFDSAPPPIPPIPTTTSIIIPTTEAHTYPLEEKISNATIRPPSILIPEFHHKGARQVDGP